MVHPAVDPFSRFFTALMKADLTTDGLTVHVAPGGLRAAAAAPAPIGQLLSLPDDYSYLFGLQQNGRHLFIRPCYPLILDAINTLFRTRTSVIVKGGTGVGKVRHRDRH